MFTGASATSPLHLSQFDLGDEEVFMVSFIVIYNFQKNPQKIWKKNT